MKRIRKSLLLFAYLVFYSPPILSLYKPQTTNLMVITLYKILNSLSESYQCTSPQHALLVSKDFCYKLCALCTKHPKVIIGSTIATFIVYIARKQGLLPITKHDLYCLKKESYNTAQLLSQRFSQQTRSYTFLKIDEILTRINRCTSQFSELKQEMNALEQEHQSLPSVVTANLKKIDLIEHRNYCHLLHQAFQEYTYYLDTTRNTLQSNLSAHSESLEKLLNKLVQQGQTAHDVTKNEIQEITNTIQQQLQGIYILATQSSETDQEAISNNFAQTLQQQLELLSHTFLQLHDLVQHDSFKKIEDFMAQQEQSVSSLETVSHGH